MKEVGLVLVDGEEGKTGGFGFPADGTPLLGHDFHGSTPEPCPMIICAWEFIVKIYLQCVMHV